MKSVTPMAGRQTYYRYGACNTRNAYVRTGTLPYDAGRYFPVQPVICRRCHAAKTPFVVS